MRTKKPVGAAKRVVRAQPSWRVASRDVEAWVTEVGGHLGPVIFDRRDRQIAPFSVAPWVEEALDPKLPPILRVLRGDFFCAPFGANASPYRGESHPVHGETANARWKLEGADTFGPIHTLHLSLCTRVRRGRVDKRIFLVDGHSAVYSEHELSGMSGPVNPGHHAMVRFPDRPGSGLIGMSRIVHGQVFPGQLEDPAQGGYSWLRAGAEFTSLESVPTVDGGRTDASRYPARRGFEDLLMVVADPDLPFAWTAVTFPGERYVWFALKNPRILAETILWISNGGRHYAPWNGRHVGVLGIEDVTSYFHYGLAESARPNPFSRAGYPTCLRLRKGCPLVVRYVLGVAVVPGGFGRVAAIRPLPGGAGVEIRDAGGRKVAAALDLDFLLADKAF